MPKKAPAPEPENHERWLVSYADFITLLFAFFVVMFASSQTDKARAKQVSEAVEKALENGSSISMSPAVAKVLGGTVDDKGQGNAMMKGPGGTQHAVKEAPARRGRRADAFARAPEQRAGKRDPGRQTRNPAGAARPGDQLAPVGLLSFRRTDAIDQSTLPTMKKTRRGHRRPFPIRFSWKGTPTPSPSTTFDSRAIGNCRAPAPSRCSKPCAAHSNCPGALLGGRPRGHLSDRFQ